MYAYKPNVGDIRTSEIGGVIAELETYGVELTDHDPQANDEAMREQFGIETVDLVLRGLSIVGGNVAYLWSINQLVKLSVTWQTGLATAVLLAIVAVSYLLPKLIIGWSLAAGLLVAVVAYEVVGISPAQAVLLLALL